MSTASLFPVVSRPTVDFLQALATHQGTTIADILGVPVNDNRRFRIRAIEVLAIENFAPVLSFFATSAGYTDVVATDTYYGQWAFVQTDGVLLANLGPYRYFIPDLNIPYLDRDTQLSVTPPTLHMTLDNEGATSKSAGAAGAVVVTTWLEPTYDR